jgi:predicted permease
MSLSIRRRVIAWRDVIVQDARYAIRGLRLRPGFTAMVVLTLSLGIGANATMFGILDKLLLRAPAHIVDPDGVVQIHSHRLGSTGVESSHPYAVYRDFLNNVPDFERVAVATSTNLTRREYYPLGRGVNATRVAGAQVSPDYFPLLGVRPYRGRFFQEAESGDQGAEKLAALGYGFWKRYFSGRDDAIGSTIELGTGRYTIVGVAPEGFTGTSLSDVDVWIPIAAADGLRFAKRPDWRTTRNSQWLNIFARLKPGVTMEHALAQATAAFRAGEAIRIAESNGKNRSNPDSVEALFGSVVPGRSINAFGLSAISGEVRVSKLLGGVAFMVLLIACANVANLMLVRALNRRRETAVRLALGISRRRLIGQLLFEGILLSLMGAAGALLCAQLGSGFIRTLLLSDASWSGSGVDGRVLLFSAVLAIACGVLTSLLPALQASRAQLTGALKAGARGGAVSRSGTRTALLVGQAALAIVLLSGAGLFVRSLRKVAELPIGIDINRVVVAEVAHASVGMSNAQARDVFRTFTERAHEVPGISAAATSLGLSFGLGWSAELVVPGREAPAAKHNPSQYAVTPEYFSVMGIRLRDGRLFTAADRQGTMPVAVINETTAKTFWAGENPLGQCVKVGADSMPCTTVVGIVANARRQQLVEQPVSQIYRPLDQITPDISDEVVSFFGYTLVARATRDPASLVEPLRRALQASAPNAPYANVHPLRDEMGRQTRAWTLGATMFSIFGALALVLAVIGLSSVVAFTIAQRRHEFGVRMALGATGSDLVRLTVFRGVLPAAAGVVIGLLLAVLGGRLVAGLLFELSPRDPAVLATVSVVLLLAAALASLIPALRVRKTNPMIALRTD